MTSSLDPIRIVPIVRCEDCPYGIIKGAVSDSPMLICRHPLLKKERILSIKSPTAPPKWCNLTSFSELIMKNRHDVIKIIEEAYGPLHINPWEKTSPFKKPDDGKESWEKTYWKRYMMERLQDIYKDRKTGRKRMTYSSPKTKKSGT